MMELVDVIVKIVAGVIGAFFLKEGVESVQDSNKIIRKKEKEHDKKHEHINY